MLRRSSARAAGVKIRVRRELRAPERPPVVAEDARHGPEHLDDLRLGVALVAEEVALHLERRDGARLVEQREAQLRGQRLDLRVARVDELAAELHLRRELRRAKREDPASDAIVRVEHARVDAALREAIRAGEAREPRADDHDAGIGLERVLDVGDGGAVVRRRRLAFDGHAARREHARRAEAEGHAADGLQEIAPRDALRTPLDDLGGPDAFALCAIGEEETATQAIEERRSGHGYDPLLAIEVPRVVRRIPRTNAASVDAAIATLDRARSSRRVASTRQVLARAFIQSRPVLATSGGRRREDPTAS